MMQTTNDRADLFCRNLQRTDASTPYRWCTLVVRPPSCREIVSASSSPRRLLQWQ